MRGNDLISLLAVMAAWRLPTRTQQAAMPMLVILNGSGARADDAADAVRY